MKEWKYEKNNMNKSQSAFPNNGNRRKSVLARQAGECEDYINSARIFVKLAEGKISEAYTYVMNSSFDDVDLFKAVEQEC